MKLDVVEELVGGTAISVPEMLQDRKLMGPRIVGRVGRVSRARRATICTTTVKAVSRGDPPVELLRPY